MNQSRGNVGLCCAVLRSEQQQSYQKDYVYAFGGCSNKLASKACERYSVKADIWMSISDLQIARISPTGIVIQDYLYVFGGRD